MLTSFAPIQCVGSSSADLGLNWSSFQEKGRLASVGEPSQETLRI